MEVVCGVMYFLLPVQGLTKLKCRLFLWSHKSTDYTCWRWLKKFSKNKFCSIISIRRAVKKKMKVISSNRKFTPQTFSVFPLPILLSAYFHGKSMITTVGFYRAETKTTSKSDLCFSCLQAIWSVCETNIYQYLQFIWTNILENHVWDHH